MKLLSSKILPKSYLNEETSSLTNSISSIFFWMRLEFEETSSVFFWMRFESSVMFLAITSINHLFWFLRAAFSSRMSSMLLEEDSEILLLFFFESSEISCSKRQWKYDWVKVFHSLILTNNPLSKKGEKENCKIRRKLSYSSLNERYLPMRLWKWKNHQEQSEANHVQNLKCQKEPQRNMSK